MSEQQGKYKTEKKVINNLSKRLQVWNKTNGRCWYCGINLVVATNKNKKGNDIFTVDHVDNFGSDDISNLVPSCSRCNKIKKQRTLEEFRLYLSMPKFNNDQINYLNSFGIEIPKPNLVVFYGEAL